MPDTDQAALNQLRDRGVRLTPQRLAILQTVLEADRHLSPREVFERSSVRIPGLTEPTVYRTLTFLCDHGVLMATRARAGNLVYEAADDLHHHLVCRECGESVEIGHDAFEALYATILKQTGFALDERHITLFGLCPACQGG